MVASAHRLAGHSTPSMLETGLRLQMYVHSLVSPAAGPQSQAVPSPQDFFMFTRFSATLAKARCG